jgi:hypothetical protein
MALMDVFTHFSIIRRERRGIRPEEIKKNTRLFLYFGSYYLGLILGE